MQDYSSPVFPTGLLISGFILVVAMIAGLWKVFRKAGYEGWESIIPIYNYYILTKIIGKPWWWVILMCIPYVSIVWGIWSSNLLSKSFGKSEGFTVGLVFLPFIFFPILGFGDAKYLGPYGDPAAFAAYNKHNEFDFENNQQA